MIEEWEDIDFFSRYQISSKGRVLNVATNSLMRTSLNNFGHPKISLLDDRGQRHTRSVAMLVAEAFVEPPNTLCDRIIWLNGDLSDVRAENLVWRPRWFCWKYSRQLKLEAPHYCRNLRVVNLNTDREYENIVEAAMSEGLLYEQIWHSTYSGKPVFPHGSIWAINERV